jgi:uncharacterized repeat protein (TIGR01451 family)
VDALAAVNAAAAVSADLGVTQSDSPDPSLPAVSVTYAMTISNAGPAAATGVTLVDTVTGAATVDLATPSQGTCMVSANTVSCDLGALDAGATVTVQVTATPSASGTLQSSAGVLGDQLDPNASNDQSLETTTVADCPFAAPGISAPVSVPPATAGQTASVASGPGHAIAWSVTGGTLDGGQDTNVITFTSGDPGTTMVLGVEDSLGDCVVPANALVSVDFLDVPPENGFHDFVNTVARNGVTAGCGAGIYCPGAAVNRAQMAVFLLKAKLGAAHVPPPASGTAFLDVPAGSFAADWIEELASLGVTAGCGNGNFCPGATLTRAQMAVFLLRMLDGSAYVPPPAVGVFEDVPVGSFAADWIEALYALNVTGGCSTSPLLFCPDNPNTRGQMAVFLAKTFGLP